MTVFPTYASVHAYPKSKFLVVDFKLGCFDRETSDKSQYLRHPIALVQDSISGIQLAPCPRKEMIQ